MIEDKHGDSIGYIRFPITSSLDYEAISDFYRITGAVPYQVENHPDVDCVISHLVRLRHLPSLVPMGLTAAPDYTVEYQTDSFEHGVTRLIIRDHEKRCVVRFERDFSGSRWFTYANDKRRLKYFTD